MLLTCIQDMSSPNHSHNTHCTAKEDCVHGNIIFERAQCNDVCTYFLCVVLPVWQDRCAPASGCETIHTRAVFLLQIWQKGRSHARLSFGFFPWTWICVMCGDLASICTQYGLPLTVFTHVVGIPTLWWRIIFIFVAYCTLTFEMMTIACLTCGCTSEV
jgi:hypothetical protein